jgi:hypothetical protein
LILCHHLARHLQGGRFHEAPGLPFVSQQRFDFPAQGFIACTGLLEEAGSLAWLKLQGRIIQPLNLLKTFGVHK